HLRSLEGERSHAARQATQRDPEDVSRRGAGAPATRSAGRLRVRRTPGGVLVQSFLHLGRERTVGTDLGWLVRARSDPPACVRTLQRDADGGGAASGDAVLLDN